MARKWPVWNKVIKLSVNNECCRTKMQRS